MRRLFYLIWKEFLQLKRDRMMLPMIFILPIVQLILFGYAASTDIRNIKMVVLDQDKSAISRQLVNEFTNAGFFTVEKNAAKEADIRDELDNDRALVALIIPPGTAEDLAAGKPISVQVVVDGTNSNTGIISLNYANQILNRRSLKILRRRLYKAFRTNFIPGIEARVRMLYNPELKSVNFMVPSLIGIILMIGAMSNTSQAIVRERDQGTLEHLIVTPVKRWELILGKIIPYGLIGLLQVTAIFLLGITWFKVPFRGSVAVLYLMTTIFLFASLGQGLLVSTISKTRQQAIMATMMFMMPAFLLSGFVFPVENMPKAIFYLSYLVPMRYFLDIVHAIFLKGVGIPSFWQSFLLLTIYSIGVFALSVTRFHKKIGD